MATKKKDPAAVKRGRKGGKIGGPARAARLSPERRTEIARKAGAAGGKARAANMTEEERRESALKAAAANNAARAKVKAAARVKAAKAARK
jgi:hypothetical protein